MADGTIPIANPTATDQRLDAESLTVAGLTVLRERVQLGGTASGELTRIVNTDPTSDLYGPVVRFPPSANLIGRVTLASASGTTGGVMRVSTMPADPFGTIADVAVAAGATGSYSAKLRRLTQGVEDLKTLTALAGSTNPIGRLSAGSSGTTVGRVQISSMPNVTLAGATNAIGRLASGSSGATIGRVQIASMPNVTLGTSTNPIGRVQIDAPSTHRLQSVAVNVTASGLVSVVTSGASQIIRVHKAFLVSDRDFSIFDGTASNLTNPLQVAALALGLDSEPWFITTSGNGLYVNTTSTGQLSGRIYYTTAQP
jgi:hypothetical protein